jgi:hypothetical protein
MWRHLGAGAAGMATVLGIAALVSRRDPQRIENVSSDAAGMSSVAETHPATRPAEPEGSMGSALPYLAPPVEVDGSSPELRTKLGRLPVAPKPPASSIPRTTRIGGVVVVNPWAP